MRSRDVIALYDTVGKGARVFIKNEPLAQAAGPLLAAGATVPPPPSPMTPAALPVEAPISEVPKRAPQTAAQPFSGGNR